MTASAIGVPPGEADPPPPRPVKARTRPGAALLEPEILRRAVLRAFVKLDPRLMVKIPVMFVVEIGSVITTIEFLARPDLFVGLVTAWLWATVLFANFAEAVAEGRGKAQADTLRRARRDTVAHRSRPGHVTAAGLQHRDQLRHRHQLAGVRGRDARPATSPTWPGWWSPSSPPPRSAWPWHSRWSGASPDPRAGSATSGWTLPGPWSGYSSRCRSSRALVLVSQGVVQNFSGFRTAAALAGGTQQIPGGPVASMEVIKLLGTNGGSMYGAGGAHPFENPTGFTNIFDLLLVIVLPFAIIFMFGRLIGRRRQALAIVAVMAVIFLGHTMIAMQAELHGNHVAAVLGLAGRLRRPTRAATWRARRPGSGRPGPR